MAIGLRAFSKYPPAVIFSRLLGPNVCGIKSVRYASLKEPLDMERPVKYSSNEAAKLKIAEMIGLQTKKEYHWMVKLIAFILATAIGGSGIYFIWFFEDNKYDKLFDSNTLQADELLTLQLNLRYCINNNLPTDALKQKIEELQQRRSQKK